MSIYVVNYKDAPVLALFISLQAAAFPSSDERRMAAPHRVLRTLFRILLRAVPTVVGVVILDFFLLRLAPGDAADVMAG